MSRVSGTPRALPRRFFERPVVELAEALIGCLLVRRRGRGLLVGRIVEAEAYGGEGLDPSAHSFRGPTPRCEVMFGPAGHAYVYTTHQGRCCVNVTAEGDARGKAVLLRALEPLRGVDAMRALRLAVLPEGPTRARLAGGAEHALASGPACLCRALDVDRAFNGADLTDPRAMLWIAEDVRRGEPVTPRVRPATLWTPRIGLNAKSASAGWHWRVVAPDSRAVSSPAVHRRGGRRRPRPARCPARRPARSPARVRPAGA
jgi:DNA-3-methyladenine glycosylase